MYIYIFGVIKIHTVLCYAVEIYFIFYVEQKLHAGVTVGIEFILVTRFPANIFVPDLAQMSNLKLGWRVH